MPLIVKCNNGVVTDTYLEIIGEALSSKYGIPRYTNEFSDALKEPKTELIVVARTVDAYQLIMKGYKHVIVWFQGVEPEESYMSHKSKIRFWILSYMEKIILKRAEFMFFVSDEMRQHYEKKYNIKIHENKYYCMPCMNTQIHKEAFAGKNKYVDNTFVYVGSMAVWQKFEDTAKTYKEIEESGIPKCKLVVYTKEKQKAEMILNQIGVKNYRIDFVKNEELPNALKDAKYGFILRDDTTVNRVATPTKISTYLSCGLIPIYSSCLKDFSNLAKNMKYAIVQSSSIMEEIRNMAEHPIDNREVFREYERIFDTYYSRSMHIKKIREML